MCHDLQDRSGRRKLSDGGHILEDAASRLSVMRGIPSQFVDAR